MDRSTEFTKIRFKKNRLIKRHDEAANKAALMQDITEAIQTDFSYDNIAVTTKIIGQVTSVQEARSGTQSWLLRRPLELPVIYTRGSQPPGTWPATGPQRFGCRVMAQALRSDTSPAPPPSPPPSLSAWASSFRGMQD